jgi:Transposase DDE domain/Transposase domain (DUF772)
MHTATLTGLILDMPEIQAMTKELEDLRWTGRRGYSTRSLVGACLIKHLYRIPEWTRTAALIAEHPALQEILGDTPSVYALYRFAGKLRRHRPLLEQCLDRLAASLRAQYPDYGRDVVIDGSAIVAFSNGQKRVSRSGPLRKRFSDPDASSGHRSASSTRSGGWVFGYKAHLAACVATELPIALLMQTGSKHEINFAVPLLDAVHARGFSPNSCAMDEGYDAEWIHEAFEKRGCHPVIPLREKTLKRGEHVPPVCEHGERKFGGAENDRKTAKWLCSADVCKPVRRKASRLHPLIPYGSIRWKRLFAGRSAVERVFSRLQDFHSLDELRVRGIDRVALHGDLCLLAMLAQALARARALPQAA